LRARLSALSIVFVALVFGLLHGFGFAGALHDVGLPGHAIPLALFLFNVGVEAGQLIFVASTSRFTETTDRSGLAISGRCGSESTSTPGRTPFARITC
jgi:hypothetical protein